MNVLDFSHLKGDYIALVGFPEFGRVLVLKGLDERPFTQNTALRRIKEMARHNAQKMLNEAGILRIARDSDFVIDSFSYQGNQVFLR